MTTIWSRANHFCLPTTPLLNFRWSWAWRSLLPPPGSTDFLCGYKVCVSFQGFWSAFFSESEKTVFHARTDKDFKQLSEMNGLARFVFISQPPCWVSARAFHLHVGILIAFIRMNKASISGDRFWRICVYNLIASHLRKPDLRNIGWKLTQPITSDRGLTHEWVIEIYGSQISFPHLGSLTWPMGDDTVCRAPREWNSRRNLCAHYN